jgi:predicted AlkP superfamily pyrophosphatase or phosphodiesterase
MSSLLLPLTLLLAPAQPKVLIVGIDGCRPDALRKAHAPHLHDLIKQGAFSDRAQTGDVTVSGPGWSSLLTGVWRGKHGVRDNGFEGANFKSYPHLFRRLKGHRPRAFTASVVAWAPINAAILADVDLAVTVKEDKEAALRAEQVLVDRDPDALFVHFNEVDVAATALQLLGVGVDPHWGLDGRQVGLRAAGRRKERAR